VITIGVLYFIDVFVGMLLVMEQFDNEGAYEFLKAEETYKLNDRPYDIIEIGLIILIVLETAAKVAFSTKSSHSNANVSS
jgi:hypothetical protein